jgi:acyl carrier protein
MIRAAADAEIGHDELSATARTGSGEDDIQARVSGLVKTFGKGDVTASDDLEAAGFSSLDFVNLMLTVEESFAVKIPSARMTPGNFRTVQSIAALVHSLHVGA